MSEQTRPTNVSFTNYLLFVAIFLLSLFQSLCLAAQPDIQWQTDYTQTSDQLVARLVITLPDGYYAYAPNADPNLAISLNLSTNQTASQTAQIIYPPARLQPDPLEPDKQVPVYSQQLTIFIALPGLTPPPQLYAELRITLCSKQNCLPLRQNLTFDWPSTSKPEPWLSNWPQLLQQAEQNQLVRHITINQLSSSTLSSAQTSPPAQSPSLLSAPVQTMPSFSPRYLTSFEPASLWSALSLGFLAGLILNLMPCVLPVLTLKVASFLHGAGQTLELRQKSFREHNILFAAGIITWFVCLALVIGGFGYAWGGLFQSTAIVYALLLLIFLLGLSLFEVFNLPVLDLKLNASNSPRLQAYLTGLMATLLATPCSGPLLGGVLSFAALAPLTTTLLIFLCLGLGMATPYLILAARPGLAIYLPKPGPWTLYLERIFGFLLLATSIYLLSILPAKLHLRILCVLLLTALVAWIWGNTNLRLAKTSRQALGILLGLTIMLGSWWALHLPATPPSPWQNYSQTQFLASLGKEPMLVEFTADWCPTCKVLEQTVLTPGNLKTLPSTLHLIKVDMTQAQPEQDAFLRSLGSVSIPLTAIFPQGILSNSPLVLRDIYTWNQLQQAIQKVIK